MTITIADALRALRPNDSFIIRGEISYSNIELADKSKTLPTEDELNAKVTELTNAEPMKLLREERDRRIAKSDWRVIKAKETSTNIPTTWKTYRQALRDLPSTQTPVLDSNNPIGISSVTWPTEPT